MATASSNAAAIGVQDVVVRLGLDVKTSEEVKATPSTSKALTAFSDAPTLRAIAYDLDRVAASTSDNPVGARADWARRRVNELDTNGSRTDKPRIIGVGFTGTRKEIQGVEDRGIAAFIELPGIGKVEIQPLFVAISGLQYVVENEDGLLTADRIFYGTVYAPKGDKGPFKFVPVEFADPKLIERWNGLVDLGVQTGTIHQSWPKIQHVNLGLGRVRRLHHAPLYLIERNYTDKVRGRERKHTVVIIGSWCGKAMQMHEKSQAVPPERIEENQKAWKKGEEPLHTFEFQLFERYGSVELVLLGRASEDRPQVIDITTGAEMIDPFDILGISMERFEPDKARRQLEAWKTLSVDRHPLREKATEIGRIVEGMSRAAIRPQLEELGREAVARATELWQDAVDGAWEILQRGNPADLPTLEACLAGGKFEEVRERLNRDDAAAAWLSGRLSDRYNHAVTAHRELRRRLIGEIERRARKAAKEAEPVLEGGASDPDLKVVEVAEAPDLLAQADNTPAS